MGKGDGGIEVCEQPIQVVESLDQREGPAQVRSGRESVQVPGDAFADIAHALVLAEVGGEEFAVASDDVGDLAEVGGVGIVAPVNAAESSANNHGRPRQPRPMTTPSQPVAAIMASASPASKMSPLPSTGMVVTVCLSSAMRFQSASPE